MRSILRPLGVLSLFLVGCGQLVPVAPPPETIPNLAPQLPPIPKYSLDQLGAARYRTVAIASQPTDMGVGVFTQKEIFGDGYPVVEGWLRKGVPLIRYNLRWSDTHSFSRADIPKVVAEARRFVPLMERYNAHCHVSGATEHKLNAADAQAFADAVLAVLPEKCVYLNNPWIRGGGKLLRDTDRIWNEVHGSETPPAGNYTYSFDGTAAEDSDTQTIKNKHTRAKNFAFWGPRNNGHFEGVSLPRSQRRGWPDAKYLQSLISMVIDKGVTNITRGALYKSHSENKGTGDVRAEKPVIIVRNRISALRLGRISCGYYGAYSTPGYYRYYCPKWGYEIGHTPMDLFAGPRKIGRINPVFREGYYR